MDRPFRIAVDRAAKASLAKQIRNGIGAAIRDGRLPPGARLPSWRDLAAQLGVARGTVRIAYERLVGEQLVLAMGDGGTRVAAPPPAEAAIGEPPDLPPLPELYPDFSTVPS